MNGNPSSIEGPYILWTDYGVEGWIPTSFKTLKDALNAPRFHNGFIITKVVEYDVTEKGSDAGDPQIKLMTITGNIDPNYPPWWRV